MEKILHYQEKEKKLFEKCLRRVDAALLEEGNDSFSLWAEQPESLESEQAFLLKEDGRIKSFAALQDDLLNALFPKSKKGSKLYDLYEEAGFQEERVILLSCFASDPADWGKGYMSKLFQFLENTFKNVSWLALVPLENEKAARFLWKHGYRSIRQAIDFEGHEGKPMALFANKLRRKGLASLSF